MKKNFEGVRAKLQDRASFRYPTDAEKREQYVQDELNKIYYYSPKYEEARAIIEANALILFPVDKTVIVAGQDKNFEPRKQYVLDELAKLMAKLPTMEALKLMFYQEALVKYPNFTIDKETGERKPFDAAKDWMLKRMRTV